VPLRVRFVEPRPAGRNVYDLTSLPRLGLPLIATILDRAGHDVAVFCEVLDPVDLDECLHADLVGISTTTATSPAAYRLADLLGEAGVPVVVGGPHVTFMADEALEHAPYVVRGEGETTIAELVAALEHGHDLASIEGLSYRDERGDRRHNPARRRCSQEQFQNLPAPELSFIRGHEKMGVRPLMTQWGCPFDCEFCSVTAMFSRSVRHRRAEQVVSELADLEAERVFFYDDNFVVNKARTTGILQAMEQRGVTPTWFAQVRADSAQLSKSRPEPDEDFLSLMYRAGCRMVMIGIEAVTEQGLGEIGKKISVSTIEDGVRAFQRHGIAVHGMFVAGLDSDTAGSAETTADFARRLGIDTFQLMIETPLPGTKLWDRVTEQKRLLSGDWSLFDGHHVVMEPAQMTPLELQLSVLRAMRRFYSWPLIVRSGLAGLLHRLPDLTDLARPRAVRVLPALLRAAWARQWSDLSPMLELALPTQARQRLAESMWIPALRFYARRQLTSWTEEPSSKDHLAFLGALS
jgi:radical SAM superfamily enzyme YgiQ (UPF0313 family)